MELITIKPTGEVCIADGAVCCFVAADVLRQHRLGCLRHLQEEGHMQAQRLELLQPQPVPGRSLLHLKEHVREG